MRYRLRFKQEEIRSLAEDYSYGDQTAEERVVNEIGPRALQAGFYKRADFLELCYWKSPRSRPRCKENEEAFIKEVTGIALACRQERLRIEVLTLLRGVSWPTASVLLHFGHRERYPILDFRALWSLEIDVPVNYNFEFWWDYVVICRELASKYSVDMRTLDRALWQYSKVNRDSGTASADCA